MYTFNDTFTAIFKVAITFFLFLFSILFFFESFEFFCCFHDIDQVVPIPPPSHCIL